ncbi:MAG: S8 family serine peptidase [Methanobacteriota archaeon]|nr:MAG: S8 family serine peptidase [Euryarchaeota archaeon]
MSFALISVLVLSVFSAFSDESEDSEEESGIYSVYGPSRNLVSDDDVIESYESFVLTQLTDSEVSELRQKGIGVIRENRLSTIALDGFIFDTTEGAPEVPELLQVGKLRSGVTYSYLLQFIGPIKTDWVEILESLDVQVEDYVPYNAFLVRMTPEMKETVEMLSFVQWIGFYEPMYRVRPVLWTMTEETLVEIILYIGESNSQVLSLLGNRVVDAYDAGGYNIVVAEIHPIHLPVLAKLNEVFYIEPKNTMVLFNRNAQAVFQTNLTRNDPGARKIWDMGIDGEGQIVTVADTGLDYDHAMFRQSNEFPTWGDQYNVTDLNRRKMVRYMVMKKSNPEDDPWAWKDSARVWEEGNATSGHGTSVAAAVVGDDSSLGNSPNDGMAKGAKLIVQDIGTVCRSPLHGGWWADCLTYIPANYTEMFYPAYENGSRIHSNSWGSWTSAYDNDARMVDLFMWNYPDMLITIANGNGGPCSWGTKHNTGSPATAKSIMSVGMTEGYRNHHNVSCGSSTGPTGDMRRKPTTLAFGSGRSATSSGDPYDEFNYTSEGWFGGSSYATPLTSGMAAMIRQYFEEGWYPGGTPIAEDSFNPSAALVKAMIVNSAQEMPGNNSDMSGEGLYPNNSQGWGRPLLDDVMYFQGDKRKLIAVDNKTIDYTGQQKNFTFNVKSDTEPLKISLVWTDYPGSIFTFHALVNDLNLLVTDPLGNEYKGNVFWNYSDPNPGESRPDYGLYDMLNPVEGVKVKNPIPGEWSIQITGYDIPKGPQPFAFVVSGIIEPKYIQQIAPPTNIWAEVDGVSNQNVKIAWDLSLDDPGLVDHYSIYFSTDYNEEGAGYRYRGQVPAGNNTFIHPNAGDGNILSFYYYVQANGTGNETGRSGQQVGKFARMLYQGMEFVSIPLELKSDSIQTVLQTVWDSFDMVRIYDTITGDWQSYWGMKAYGEISTLNHEKAFWIRVTEMDVFIVAGRVIDTVSLQLFSGWNMVGYPSLRNSSVSDALYSISYVTIEGYDNNPPYYLRTLNGTSTIATGYGYWVYVQEDQTWTVYTY